MPSPAAETRMKSVDEENADSSKRGDTLLWLWTVIAVGLLLRIVALGHKSFWIDEIASVAIARRTAPVFWHFLWHDEGNMALYYVLLRPWLHLGYGEATVRLLSVLPGVLSIPMMYLLGSRLFGRRTGILAAVLVALSPCAIGVSQEARAYSFLVLTVLLSTYLFVRLIEKPSYTGAAAYAIVAGLTFYFQYFGVLVPAAHALSLAAAPRAYQPRKPLLLAAAIVIMMAIPILWLMHAQSIGHISWVRPTSWLELYHLGVFLAASGGKAVGAVLLALELTLMGFFAARFKRAWRASHDDLLRWRYALVTSLVVSPIVITLLVSIVRPVFYHRFLIICLPGWLLMAALGIEQVRSRRRQTVVVAAVCLLSLAATVILYRRVTEDWRGAVTYLIANARPGDRVLYYQSVGEFAGESYCDWLPGGNRMRPAPVAVDPSNMKWFAEMDHAQHVWLVLYRTRPGSLESQRIAGELVKQYQLSSRQNFRGVTVLEYRAK